MKSKSVRKTTIAALMLLYLVRCALAQGNLVVNGGFDVISNGIPANWMLTGNCFSDVKFGNSYPSLQFTHSSEIGGASQSIDDLIPGDVYIISGDYESIENTSVNFEVTIGGVDIFHAVTTFTNRNWQSFSSFYTATSSSSDLSINVLAFSGYTFNIDNIAMYATPEPSPSWLLFLGSGVLISCLRKQFVRS